MNPPNSNPPPPPAPAPKILRRPTHGRKLAGVAQSIADYLVIDATIVRILFVICGFLGGSGVILYLAGAILIPSEDGAGANFTTIDSIKRDRSTATIIGLIVAAVGSIVLLGELSDSDLIAPLLLVAVGCGLLLWKSDGTTGVSGGTGNATVAAPPSPGVPGDTAAKQQVSGYEPPPVPTSMNAFGAAQEQPYGADATEPIPPAPRVGSDGDVPWVPPQATQPTPPPSQPKPKRPKSRLPWLALAGLMMFFGIAIVLNESGALNVDADRTIAWGLAGVGGVLAYSAFFGRARSLIFVGLLMLPIMFAAGETVDGFNINFETTRVQVDGLNISEVRGRTNETGVGSVEYDLRNLDLDGGTETIDIEHGVGEVLVRVPDDVELDIDASAGVGDVDILGRQAGGPGAEMSYGSGSGNSNGKLILDIEIGIGEIKVTK